jgi:hypothetical protein
MTDTDPTASITAANAADVADLIAAARRTGYDVESVRVTEAGETVTLTAHRAVDSAADADSEDATPEAGADIEQVGTGYYRVVDTDDVDADGPTAAEVAADSEYEPDRDGVTTGDEQSAGVVERAATALRGERPPESTAPDADDTDEKESAGEWVTQVRRAARTLPDPEDAEDDAATGADADPVEKATTPLETFTEACRTLSRDGLVRADAVALVANERGLSRESVDRLLTKWEARGLIYETADDVLKPVGVAGEGAE